MPDGDARALRARWKRHPYAVEPGTPGTQGFAEAIENLRQTSPDLQYSIDALEQHGDHFAVAATLHARGSGEMSWPRHHVWTLREGKVCHFRWFSDPAEARAALQS